MCWLIFCFLGCCVNVKLCFIFVMLPIFIFSWFVALLNRDLLSNHQERHFCLWFNFYIIYLIFDFDPWKGFIILTSSLFYVLTLPFITPGKILLKWRTTKFEVNFGNYFHAYNAYIYFAMHHMLNKTRLYPWSKFFK